jgi:hypothetical protein
MEADTV